MSEAQAERDAPQDFGQRAMNRRLTKYMLGFATVCFLAALAVMIVHLRTESRTFHRLQQKIPVHFGKPRFEQYVDHLARESDVDIKVDWDGLAAEGIEPETVLQIEGRGPISTDSALFLLGRRTNYKVGYKISGDRVIVSTSDEVGSNPPAWLNGIYHLMP